MEKLQLIAVDEGNVSYIVEEVTQYEPRDVSVFIEKAITMRDTVQFIRFDLGGSGVESLEYVRVVSVVDGQKKYFKNLSFRG